MAPRGRKPTPPTTHPQRARTLAEVGKKLGIPYERAKRLRKDGLELGAGGYYDLRDAERLARQRTQRAPTSDGDDGELTFTEKQKLLKAKRMREEWKLTQEMGTTVRKDFVRAAWRHCILKIKNRLKGLGRELAPRIALKGPQEVQALIDERVMEILRLFADPEFYRDDDHRPGPRPRP